jgi:NAD+ kinase
LRLDRSYKLLKKIENIGIILKPNSPELKDAYLKIKYLFENKNINIFLEEQSAKMIDASGFSFEDLCSKVDFLVSVGGELSRYFRYRQDSRHRRPLGFLTSPGAKHSVCGIRSNREL